MLVIDFIKPMAVDPKTLTKTGAQLLDKVVELALNDVPQKEAPLDEHAAQYRKAVMNSISLESSRLLMERGTAKNPETGLYTITRDPKIKSSFYYSFPNEFLVEMAKNIRCKILVLRATKGLVFEHPRVIKAVQDEMQKAAESMEIVEVEGKHHVHMDQPEIVAPYVLNYLFNR